LFDLYLFLAYDYTWKKVYTNARVVLTVINNKIVESIKNKEMDRKDFLKYSGLAVLSVVGLKAVANLLTKQDNQKLSKNESSRGFGGGKYGA